VVIFPAFFFKGKFSQKCYFPAASKYIGKKELGSGLTIAKKR
jgi:hypothetical protein